MRREEEETEFTLTACGERENGERERAREMARRKNLHSTRVNFTAGSPNEPPAMPSSTETGPDA